MRATSSVLTAVEFVLTLPAMSVAVTSEHYINTRGVPASELAPLTGALALIRAVAALRRTVAECFRVHAFTTCAFKLISHAMCACRNNNAP